MKSSRKAKALAFSAAFTLTLLIVVPLSTRPVMAQATTGTIKGKTNSGSRSSRARVAAAIAEKSVTMVAIPRVPKPTIGSNVAISN